MKQKRRAFTEIAAEIDATVARLAELRGEAIYALEQLTGLEQLMAAGSLLPPGRLAAANGDLAEPKKRKRLTGAKEEARRQKLKAAWVRRKARAAQPTESAMQMP
jgi:hypothetical protein